MNKELEALCNLTQMAYNYTGFDEELTKHVKGYFEIIETKLKRYSKIEQFLIKRGFDNLEDFTKEFDEYVEMNEKDHQKLMMLGSQTCQEKLKAFKIIEEKRVNVYNFCWYLEHHKDFTYEVYRKILDEHNEDLYDFYEITEFYKPGTELTQEEFDLLREVLKCGK